MLTESNGSSHVGGNAPKLRTACENCRQSKVKCNLSGKNVCTRCLRHGLQCQYGFANRSGKPKGSKNRATLRKLGQLQEDKSPIRGFRGNRIVPPVIDREPRVPSEHPSHMGDPMMNNDMCLIPGPSGFWESPRSFGSTTALDTPICPSNLGTADGSPFTDLMDSCPTMPLGLGYPHTPVTPTFLLSDSLIDGMASPPFGESVSSPYPSAPCECVDKQIFYMNRLNHLLAESMSLRFDNSLQAIKATFCACQVFMQCVKCTKDSANLILVISVLNLTLQIFEYWISREALSIPRAELGGDIRYGYYELGQDDNRQIRAFLLRKLLLQCKDVLSVLSVVANTVCLETPKLLDGEGSAEPSMKTEDLVNQPWASSEHFSASFSHHLESDTLSGSGSNCLLPVIVGYEATVEAFLQSVSSNCICGSKYSVPDESH